MKVESLAELESAFEQWRRRKRHVRESMPRELLARARRATKQHGVKAVVRATRVERDRPAHGKAPEARSTSRPSRSKRARGKVEGVRSTKPKGVPGSAPTFSRLEVNAPVTSKARPVAEVETSGVTLRVFEQTPELLRLLSAVCGFGGVR